MDYQKEIHIDQDRLDKEWVQQPVLFLRYAEEASRARADADRTKEHLAVVKAEVEANIRTAYEGGKKPTENAIAAEVTLDSRVRQAERENIEAWERVGLLQAAREAFAMRKDALEALVRLYGLNYFSSPAAKGEDALKARKEIQNEADRKLAKKVTRLPVPRKQP